MNPRFNFTASTQSDEALQERVENRPKYLPETVEASITELQNRGHQFTDEELQVINLDLQAQRENAALPNKGLGPFTNGYRNNIVDDPYAPGFYSRSAIYYFTIFCGGLFGSALMAINLSRINNRKGVLWILLFGVIFTTIQVIIALNVNTGSSYSIIYGFAAAFCLDLLWNRFIGNATFYRARPIWGPLAVAVVLMGLVLWVTILGGQQP